MGDLQKLQENSGFTDVENRIAEYILAHREDVPSMTIAQLGKAVSASNPAVIRLCRKCGAEG